jgi:hypothetical protein
MKKILKKSCRRIEMKSISKKLEMRIELTDKG